MNQTTITKISQNTANNPIDRLGALKAQIAVLTDEAKPLEADIKAMGAGKHSGQLFDATVADVAPSESYDAEDMEKKLRELGVTDNWFRHHVKTKAGYQRLTVKARGGFIPKS